MPSSTFEKLNVFLDDITSNNLVYNVVSNPIIISVFILIVIYCIIYYNSPYNTFICLFIFFVGFFAIYYKAVKSKVLKDNENLLNKKEGGKATLWQEPHYLTTYGVEETNKCEKYCPYSCDNSNCSLKSQDDFKKTQNDIEEQKEEPTLNESDELPNILPN